MLELTHLQPILEDESKMVSFLGLPYIHLLGLPKDDPKRIVHELYAKAYIAAIILKDHDVDMSTLDEETPTLIALHEEALNKDKMRIFTRKKFDEAKEKSLGMASIDFADSLFGVDEVVRQLDVTAEKEINLKAKILIDLRSDVPDKIQNFCVELVELLVSYGCPDLFHIVLQKQFPELCAKVGVDEFNLRIKKNTPVIC